MNFIPLKHVKKQRQLSRARHAARVQRANARKPGRKPRTTKAAFIRALAGTGGIIAAIARNLGVRWNTVDALLKREEWGDVRELYEAERETAGDTAEETIMDVIRQRRDLATAAATARWYLSKRRKTAYGEESTVKVVGGGKDDEPVKIMQATVDISTLDLPVEAKRKIVEALDRKRQAEETAEIAASAVKALPGRS